MTYKDPAESPQGFSETEVCGEDTQVTVKRGEPQLRGMETGGQGWFTEVVLETVGLFKMTHAQTTNTGEENGGECFITEQGYPPLHYEMS